MRKVTWMGSTKCDLCGKEAGRYLYDGPVAGVGAFAVMCEECYGIHGSGAAATKYEKASDGIYVKVTKKKSSSAGSFNDYAMAVMMELGLTEDEAEGELSDFGLI